MFPCYVYFCKYFCKTYLGATVTTIMWSSKVVTILSYNIVFWAGMHILPGFVCYIKMQFDTWYALACKNYNALLLHLSYNSPSQPKLSWNKISQQFWPLKELDYDKTQSCEHRGHPFSMYAIFGHFWPPLDTQYYVIVTINWPLRTKWMSP